VNLFVGMPAKRAYIGRQFGSWDGEDDQIDQQQWNNCDRNEYLAAPNNSTDVFRKTSDKSSKYNGNQTNLNADYKYEYSIATDQSSQPTYAGYNQSFQSTSASVKQSYEPPWASCVKLVQVTSASFNEPTYSQPKGFTNTFKTTISTENNERIRWKAIQANMSLYDLDKSPYARRTFKEYIDVKLETAIAKEELALKKWIDAEANPHPLLSRSLRDSVSRADQLMPVLGQPSICTDAACSWGNTEWPSTAELKANGPVRAWAGKPRVLPVPRPGPDVLRELLNVNHWGIQSPIYDGLTVYEAAEMDDPTEPVQELELSELNETIRGLLEDIDAIQ
jgi:uncharacterized protein (DUF2461 family)